MKPDFNNIDNFLGKKIRIFRHKVNWPLKALASELGISVQQVQRYEEGVNKIPSGILYRLSLLLNIPITDFFEGFGDSAKQGNDEPATFNILLIEDNLQDEFIFRKSLEDFPKKLNILTINDGKKALDFLRSINESEVTQFTKPELVFLDLNLPDMQGFDILRELKRKSAFRNIPVIIMSNSQNDEDISSSYSLQASGFIRKSFSYDEYKDNCFKVLDYWSTTVTLPN